MGNEFKDGEKAIQGLLDKINADAAATAGFIRIPIVCVACAICVLLGFIAGHIR